MKKTRKMARVKKKVSGKKQVGSLRKTLSLEEQIRSITSGLGAAVAPRKSAADAEAIFFCAESFNQLEETEAFRGLPERQQALVQKQPQVLHRGSYQKRRVFFYWRDESQNFAEKTEKLTAAASVKMRDAAGNLLTALQEAQLKSVIFKPLGSSLELYRSFALGWEMAAYRFKTVSSSVELPQAFVLAEDIESEKPAILEALDRGRHLACATNLARHLVNLPGNILNPASYASVIKQLFFKKASVQVSLWDERRLRSENMNLHVAVGQGAEHGPCMVHVRYRPKNSKEERPLAFVGKGITFDSGGLDIKPSSGMRLMKKDMGGSAALVGFAWWCISQKIPQALDFYFPLAENAVSSRSFRPGDIFTGRSGLRVEIHNTDAEGRLILADSLDVAVKQPGAHRPSLVIDVATLTGAIKVALGAQIAGLFSNDEALTEELFNAGLETGEFCWPMPLFQNYRSLMSSNFADMTNAVDGFGGAITAALFLESFVDKVPWAHLDIYAWKDGGEGAIVESGASGQGVQLLAHWLAQRL